MFVSGVFAVSTVQQSITFIDKDALIMFCTWKHSLPVKTHYSNVIDLMHVHSAGRVFLHNVYTWSIYAGTRLGQVSDLSR